METKNLPRVSSLKKFKKLVENNIFKNLSMPTQFNFDLKVQFIKTFSKFKNNSSHKKSVKSTGKNTEQAEGLLAFIYHIFF